MRLLFFVAAIALTSGPAWAEKYNIVCTVDALGTAQVGGATVKRGHIYSLDFDTMQACLRDDGACMPEGFTLEGGEAQLPEAAGARVTFAPDKNELRLKGDADEMAGQCRRAPFTAFP